MRGSSIHVSCPLRYGMPESLLRSVTRFECKALVHGR